MNKRIKRTAYHEAAHAVAATEFDLPFRYVTVVPKDGSRGHILFTPALARTLSRFYDESPDRPTPRDEVRLGHYLSVVLAGNEAVKRLTGRYDNTGAERDYKHVFDAAFSYAGSLAQEDAFIKWRRQVAIDLVALRWDEIGHVADALLSESRLNRQQVLDAMWPRYRSG